MKDAQFKQNECNIVLHHLVLGVPSFLQPPSSDPLTFWCNHQPLSHTPSGGGGEGWQWRICRRSYSPLHLQFSSHSRPPKFYLHGNVLACENREDPKKPQRAGIFTAFVYNYNCNIGGGKQNSHKKIQHVFVWGEGGGPRGIW